MSEQPEATKPADPKPCKMGCGFFGSNATGDCCSKCWSSIKPKEDTTNKKEGSVKETEKATTKDAAEPTSKSETDSKEVAALSASSEERVAEKTPLARDDVPVAADLPLPAKKKKKKASYKSMMAGMQKGDAASRDVEKEREILKKVTGGGQFQKIDKI